VQLGKLYWNHGRLPAAKREYLIALHSFPGYHYALDALAVVEAAEGDTGRAIALGVLPFLPGGAIKIAAAVALVVRAPLTR